MIPKALEELQQIPRSMAKAIEPLFDHPTLERYRRFLNAMYFYTLPSGDQLRTAALNAPSDDLRHMFEEMSQEEVSHFRLAEEDLKSLGYSVSAEEPPAVGEFNAFWNSITPDRAFRYLGAMYVLENVAHFLRENAGQALAELGLKQDQARFIRTHLVADEEHGALLSRFAERYLSSNQEDILFGANRAAELWVRIHLDTLI